MRTKQSHDSMKRDDDLTTLQTVFIIIVAIVGLVAGIVHFSGYR